MLNLKFEKNQNTIVGAKVHSDKLNDSTIELLMLCAQSWGGCTDGGTQIRKQGDLQLAFKELG